MTERIGDYIPIKKVKVGPRVYRARELRRGSTYLITLAQEQPDNKLREIVDFFTQHHVQAIVTVKGTLDVRTLSRTQRARLRVMLDEQDAREDAVPT